VSGRKRRASGAPTQRAPAKRTRKRAPRPPKAEPASAKSAQRALWSALGLLLAALVVIVYAPLLIWAHLPGPGRGAAPTASFGLPCATEGVVAALAERGLIHSPRLFSLYLGLAHPAFRCAEHDHLLRDDMSASELVERIGASPLRKSVRAVLPEGLMHTEIGGRLEHDDVCSLAGLHAAVSDPALLSELGLLGPSAEGYLFPATYPLLVDSDAKDVVRTLVGESKKRLAKLRSAHPGAFEALEQRGFSERDVLTLASMVEKEAQAADERPLIASVFFNRLSDPDFRPARMLQSDPTAGYGCHLYFASLASCAGYQGKITPAMLRDAANPYNTYKHPGLPPGPIANPGESSIEAVLTPARTDYLYFVAKGGGRHTFSRTFSEHRDAIENPP
jgi:UPF0755 protein